MDTDPHNDSPVPNKAVPKRAQSRTLRGGRHSEPFCCYSINKCVQSRRPLLHDEANATILVESFAFARRNQWIKILAFCVMPDHYHLLFVLLAEKSLSDVVASMSKFTAAQIRRRGTATFEVWQEGFFDHRCRNTADAMERLAYIENNPVRSGLVTLPEDWRYSSASPEMKHLLDRDWFCQNS